ncbi:MAG: PRC-barrel domain-containing protein [Actinomycetes bacterium]
MSAISAYRIGDLLGRDVVTIEGRRLGVVKDVRLAPTAAIAGLRAELIVAGLVVGNRYTGAMLGYDRQPGQGPWLVRKTVRWLHRDSGYLPWSAVREIDWANGVVHVSTDQLERLSHVRDLR